MSCRVVSCRVASGRFHSALGEAACRAPDGSGRVFVRPEDLILRRWFQGDGVSGTVIARRFFGHDVLETVQSSDGQTVDVRSLSSTTVPVGSLVRLSLRERTYRVLEDSSVR